MKRLYGGLLVVSMCMFLTVYKYVDLKTPVEKPYMAVSVVTPNTTLPMEWLRITLPDFMKEARNTQEALSGDDIAIVSGLFVEQNVSKEESEPLLTWNRLESLVDTAQSLANGVDAIKEAGIVWESLVSAVEAKKLVHVNENQTRKGKEELCPQFLSKMNATEVDGSSLKLKIPCGLTQGSSITVIGIPDGLVGNFRIDLTGQPLPGEPEPPIIVHYNVRLLGDKSTEDPVIVQNSWTSSHDWGVEERCPNFDPDMNKKVDDLDECNKMVGREVNRTSSTSLQSNTSRGIPVAMEASQHERYFPFKQGFLSVATLRVGTEGMQMTVDGKHITSFAFRDTLEPWLASEVRITGNFKLISILASGLPTSEESEHVVDLEALKAPPLSPLRPLDLVIGVFSTANNFKRRMAVRRTWMQYGDVRSGRVAVRFFVGLHKSPIVNLELWNEARTYGDVQLMPFVDYYSLISWKTLAICIFGTEVDSAKFIMKTDDDAFVRVDEVLLSLSMINNTRGLIYGLINSDSQPIRNPESKWYISYEEWPEEKYPPWAHGPGYIVSRDIAESVDKLFKQGNLKMFKLEDVAMGIWIADLKKYGLEPHYENDGRIISDGCKDGYVVAHYQSPAEMTCLWRKYEETKRSLCCRDW
ncbi:Beta-1,3-galactosyltransferase GALT1 [Cardamine amara subsp. amara]|uniref:Beta-1,3-galactosyltransferase GALT1 n=1 Tax=Cardamine amara subsp. amara TaxID=228776 RepID=A0ABD0ZKG8_CARAN